MICHRSLERAQIFVRLAELYVIQGGLLAKFEQERQSELAYQPINKKAAVNPSDIRKLLPVQAVTFTDSLKSQKVMESKIYLCTLLQLVLLGTNSVLSDSARPVPELQNERILQLEAQVEELNSKVDFILNTIGKASHQTHPKHITHVLSN